MRKKILTLVAAAAMTMAMSVTAFAAGWIQDSTGWWWDNGDGTWPANEWQWLDGNADGVAECYYFGADGYMLSNTVTPDGYYVRGDGAWEINSIAQIKLVDVDPAVAQKDHGAQIVGQMDDFLRFYKNAVAGGEGHFLSEARDAYGAIRVVDKFQAVHIRIVQAQRERIDEKSDLTFLSEQDGVCKHTEMDESGQRLALRPVFVNICDLLNQRILFVEIYSCADFL